MATKKEKVAPKPIKESAQKTTPKLSAAKKTPKKKALVAKTIKSKVAGRRTASAKVYYSRNKRVNIKLPDEKQSNNDLWDYYLTTPEILQICSSIAKGISRVKFVPHLANGRSVYGPDGQPVLDKKLVDAAELIMSRIKGPLGNQSQVNYQFGGCLAVVADGYLVGYKGDPVTMQPKKEGEGGPTKELWLVLPRNCIDVKKTGDGTTVKISLEGNVGSKDDFELGEDAIIARGWIQQLNKPVFADAWLRSLTRTIDQLRESYEAMAAVVLSQINAGILIVPDSMDLPMLPGEQAIKVDDDEPNDEPGQLADIISDYVIDSAENINGANRASPLVIPLDDDVRMPEWIELGRSADPAIYQNIQDLRLRIALGSPFPPEQLLGQGQSKFYQGVHNVAQVDQDTFRYVYEPLCEIIASVYTEFVLYPGLEALGFKKEEYEQLANGWDASSLIRPQDKCKEALEMRQADPELISVAEVRESCGRPAEIYDPNNKEKGSDENPDPSSMRQASASVELTEPNYAELSQKYVEKLGIICDQIVLRMKERAGNRLFSAVNSPKFEDIYHIFQGSKPENLGKLDGAEKFAQNIKETNETLFGPAIEIFKGQFFNLSLTTLEQRNTLLNAHIGRTVAHETDEYNVQRAYEYLAAQLVGYAREDFFGRINSEENKNPPASFKTPIAILSAVAAIAGGGTDVDVKKYSITTGPSLEQEYLAAEYRKTGNRWYYGDVYARMQPYEFHENLDGKVSPTEFFGDNGEYHVHDHYNDQCCLNPIYEKIMP